MRLFKQFMAPTVILTQNAWGDTGRRPRSDTESARSEHQKPAVSKQSHKFFEESEAESESAAGTSQKSGKRVKLLFILYSNRFVSISLAPELELVRFMHNWLFNRWSEADFFGLHASFVCFLKQVQLFLVLLMLFLLFLRLLMQLQL